jgi:hypothetical protein
VEQVVPLTLEHTPRDATHGARAPWPGAAA